MGLYRTAVLSAGVCYMMFLAYMLAVGLDESREVFYRIDPSLREESEEREYADDCDIDVANLGDKMDVFVVAHSLGYLAKMLVLRDFWMCWASSLIFEHIEISLQHVLKNFRECWWDHFILDIALCNFGGILAGCLVVKIFGLQQYPWFAGISTSPRRLLHAVMVITMMMIVDSSAFFLKFFLRHPSEHFFVCGRILFWFVFSMEGYADFYGYVVRVAEKEAKREAVPFPPGGALLPIVASFLELLLALRFAMQDERSLAAAAPLVVWFPLAIAISLWVVSALFWYTFRSRLLSGLFFIVGLVALCWSHVASMPGLMYHHDTLHSLCETLLNAEGSSEL